MRDCGHRRRAHPARGGLPAGPSYPARGRGHAAQVRSETTTYCSYNGEATSFSIPAGGERSVDAIWTYEAPFDAVVGVKDHLAFYPSRVTRSRNAAPERRPERSFIMSKHAGKVAIVTGAFKEIGAAIAKRATPLAAIAPSDFGSSR